MREITTEELVGKLDAKDNFKLIMTFHAGGFQAKHIPGSINVHPKEIVPGLFDTSEELVVYCINKQCLASAIAYQQFEKLGHSNIRRYTGGLEAWEAAGHQFAGNDVTVKIDISEFMKQGA